MIKKIQIYGNPVIHSELAKKIKSDFRDCEISVTDSKVLNDQDQYFVNISSVIRDVHLTNDPSPLLQEPFRNKVVILKSSDVEWGGEVQGLQAIHKGNYNRIKEIINDLTLADPIPVAS